MPNNNGDRPRRVRKTRAERMAGRAATEEALKDWNKKHPEFNLTASGPRPDKLVEGNFGTIEDVSYDSQGEEQHRIDEATEMMDDLLK